MGTRTESACATVQPGAHLAVCTFSWFLPGEGRTVRRYFNHLRRTDLKKPFPTPVPLPSPTLPWPCVADVPSPVVPPSPAGRLSRPRHQAAFLRRQRRLLQCQQHRQPAAVVHHGPSTTNQYRIDVSSPDIETTKRRELLCMCVSAVRGRAPAAADLRRSCCQWQFETDDRRGHVTHGLNLTTISSACAQSSGQCVSRQR